MGFIPPTTIFSIVQLTSIFSGILPSEEVIWYVHLSWWNYILFMNPSWKMTLRHA